MHPTNRRAFLHLTRAWMLGITRDRATVFWMFLFPILFIVIFGLAFGRSDVGSYRVGVAVDQSTLAGRALVEALRGVAPFTISTGSAGDELARLRAGDRDAVVTLAAAPTAPDLAGAVVVSYDPSRAVAAQIVLPIIRQVVDQVDRDLSGRPQTLTVEARSVRSASLRFIDFFLPGVIGFSIMQSGMFAAIPLVQLRVGRMLKRFGATPVSRGAVLASQGLARLALALAQTAVLLLVGRLLFNIHISANWPGMLGFVLLGGIVFLALGFAISGLARTEEAVPALVQAVSFPMMFLAGVFFPIENFPRPVQALSRILPLTFLGDGLRQVMVGGAPLNPVWVDVLLLLGWLAAAAVLAVRFFKWE